MRNKSDLTDRIRYRILAGLHLGHLEHGCSVPGIRQLARDMGADHRSVAKAYRTLELEGLVEIRGRSGVYLSRQAWMPETGAIAEASWMADLMVDAWRQRVRIPDLPDLVRRYTEAGRLRCLCVESSEDCLVALCDELNEDFGLDTTPFRFATAGDSGAEPSAELESLRDAIVASDLVVTLTFHAGPVREIARQLGKPIVVVAVHAELSGAIDRCLAERPLTFVVADPLFGDRIVAMHGTDETVRDRIRVVLAEDDGAIAELDRSEPVFLTRAASASLGECGLRPLLPPSPSISTEAACELSKVIIRLRHAPVNSGGSSSKARLQQYEP